MKNFANLQVGDVLLTKTTNRYFIVIGVTEKSFILLPASNIKEKFYASKSLIEHNMEAIEVIR